MFYLFQSSAVHCASLMLIQKLICLTLQKLSTVIKVSIRNKWKSPLRLRMRGVADLEVVFHVFTLRRQDDVIAFVSLFRKQSVFVDLVLKFAAVGSTHLNLLKDYVNNGKLDNFDLNKDYMRIGKFV